MLIYLYAFPISGWVFDNAKCWSPSLILITYKYFGEILSPFLFQTADYLRPVLQSLASLQRFTRNLSLILLISLLYAHHLLHYWLNSRPFLVPLCSEKLSVNSLEPWILHQTLMTLENIMTKNSVFLSFIMFRNPSSSISKHFFLTNIHNHLIFWTTKKGKT